MPDTETLARLRRSLAILKLEDGGTPPIAFGAPAIDRALGGGLARAALHEVFGDAMAAHGFGLALTIRAAGSRKLVWVRQDMAARESGEFYPPGLAAFGADPGAFILVRVKDAVQALRAGHEALRCAALGAVVIEPYGAPKAIDLTASRRLAFAAGHSGVPLFLIRTNGEPVPSAAMSRWRVRPALSAPLAAGAPGVPKFDIELLRHRAGLPPRRFCVEWDSDQHVFREPALSRAVAPPSAGRTVAAFAAGERRKAG